MQFRHPVFPDNVYEVGEGDADSWRESGWVEVEQPTEPETPAPDAPAVAVETPAAPVVAPTPVKEG